MKRKSLQSLLAAAVLALPCAAFCQVAPEKPAAPPPTEPMYKYQANVGLGYTSINQVNQSRSGLLAVEVGATRNFGRYFGVNGQFGHYGWTVTSSNPGNPYVNMFLVGPEFHAPLFERLSGSVRGWFGAEHVGNIPIQPDYSFAGGFGIAADYALNSRMAIRLGGDDIGSSFSVVPYTSGASTHTRWNAHATVGLVYKF